MQPYRFAPLAGIRAGCLRHGLAPACLVLALAFGITPAAARPDTLAMSCAQTASLVNAQGAVLLGTGPNLFDRYVREQRFCSGFEQLKPEWVKTRDNPQCFIGYTCYVPTRDNNFR